MRRAAPDHIGAEGAATGAAVPGIAARDARGHGAENAAREICLRLLSTAPRTRVQLARALRRGGVSQEAAEEVLGRFTDTGLIDDAAFASAWVESRHHSRGLSRRMLAAELRQRGVGEEDVRGAISGLGQEQEAATARQIVDRKLPATRGQPAPVRARRLAGVLARKGYPPAMVFRVIREALEQDGTDAAEAGLDDSAEAAWLGEPPGTGDG